MNETIYMTYKKEIPNKVINRWKNLNPNYTIDFSLDNDCIHFLLEHFNIYVANLFMTIPVGMYKADLWRLCKLYVYGGVYADVDLVPYINIDSLDKTIDFYSCLGINTTSIFQAFIVNFTAPNDPLIYVFLLSFLINNPYTYLNGPTVDMFNCISYMANQPILSDTTYEIDVKLKINIGASTTNTKYIPLFYFPEIYYTTICIHNHVYPDTFSFVIKNDMLIVTRTDVNEGWSHLHVIDILFNTKASIRLFKENWGNHINACYVTHNNVKILDSRDKEYYNNHGW